jgi:hypothetical protein
MTAKRFLKIGVFLFVGLFAQLVLLEPSAPASPAPTRSGPIAPAPMRSALAAPVLPRRAAYRSRSFDWTRRGVAGYVRNQGQTPNCWAVAAVEALESNWAIRNRTRPLLAIQPVLDWSGKAGPQWTSTAFNILVRRGTTLERNYRWIGKPRRPRRVAAPYRAARWGYVVRNGVRPSVGQLKQALVTRGPLAVAVYVTPAFTNYRSGVFRSSIRGRHSRLDNHFVLLVGWDDSRRAWKIQNSWGKQWGQGGFAWVGYGCNNVGDQAAWVMARRVR